MAVANNSEFMHKAVPGVLRIFLPADVLQLQFYQIKQRYKNS